MITVASKKRMGNKRILLRTALLSWGILVITLGAFVVTGVPQQRRVFVEQLESQAVIDNLAVV